MFPTGCQATHYMAKCVLKCNSLLKFYVLSFCSPSSSHSDNCFQAKGMARDGLCFPIRYHKHCISKVFGCLLPIFALPIHVTVLYYFWNQFSRRVDRRFCSCSCWDTVFKGPYEAGVASYKHMYFNATLNSMKIWATTVVCVIALYECMRYLIALALERRLRFPMFLLFLSSIFAHYYSWWSYVNYWNDEFYSQWNHQMFFTITELASTVLVLQVADNRNSLSIRKALGISGIALLHVIAGSWDQFVLNLLHGAGLLHQVVRDLGLMLPDILHVVVPLFELRGRSKIFDEDFCREALWMTLFIFGGFIICSHL